MAGYYGGVLVMLLLTFGIGDCLQCEYQVLGQTSYISCPQIGQPSSYRYCCGPEWDRRCCDNPALNFDEWIDSDDIESIGELIGILVGSFLLLCLVVLVCCCCLPCCCLAKRRSRRGAVHGPAFPGVQVQTVTTSYPTQPSGTGGYPTQQTGYMPVQNSAYPPQQPPPAGYPSPPPGYSMEAGRSGYPEQPPPYPGPPDQSYLSKQPAFNPNAQQ